VREQRELLISSAFWRTKLGKTGIQLQCPSGHPIYLAYYRNSQINRRIKGFLYCPDCKKFFKDPRPALIAVKVT